MNTVIRTKNPVDLLAYAPYRLGFRPRESVVLLGMRPPRSAVGLVMRLDLAHVGDETHGGSALAESAELMGVDGSTDALVVIYTDLPRHQLGAASTPGRAVARLREETTWCEAPGPWVVGAEAYGVWGSGPSCEPLVSPLSDLEYGSMAATLVLEGLTVVAGRDGLRVAPAADPVHRDAAGRAYRKGRRQRLMLQGRVAGDPGHDAAAVIEAVAELAAWRRSQHHLWRRMVARTSEGKGVSAGELGRLLAGLEDVQLRDAAMCVALAPGPAWLPTMREIDHAFAGAMGPGGSPPDAQRVDPVAAVLRHAAASVGGVAAAPALGMLGWLAWWSGDSARADVLSDQCLAVAPDHRLARLVQQAVANHLPPGWVVDDAASA
ncbi:DUF4192 domain-containing protein [Georgenia sunbinii]|uniref:DUF4192 domain-containing protein n=1 Tax=Georgenia sunbinii TaxID=3117728 RepID=UPI002F26B8E2